MSKENIKKFQEELKRNAKLKERMGGLKLSRENLEELVSLAKEAGFDFTLEELKEENSKFAAEELSMDELDQVVGGFFCRTKIDDDGYWWTQVAYDCDKWESSKKANYALPGQCGSCAHWDTDNYYIWNSFGVPLRCNLKRK